MAEKPSKPSEPSKATAGAGSHVDGSKSQPSINRPTVHEPSINLKTAI